MEWVRGKFIKACKNLLGYDNEVPEHLIAVANGCCKFSTKLQGKEFSFYQPPVWLEFLSPSLEKFSRWWHWEDLHRMKELFLQAAVDEHLKLVKCEPTSLEVHVALANAYVMLSSLYTLPKRGEGDEGDPWIPADTYTVDFEEKFRLTAEKAIEEFKILNAFAPEDPWVHAQLAYSYHDLQMPKEEIREYEAIIALRPDDKETMLKLGILYFQQGWNAKGLKIYEELKESNYKKAEQLIQFYGSFV